MIKNKSWLSKGAVFFIILVLIAGRFYLRNWNNKVIFQDVISYYAYLPATFIHQDPSLEFVRDTTQDYSNQFWPRTTEKGTFVIKMSMGMSFVYAPFFGMVHIYEKMTGGQADGFSVPYHKALAVAALVYLLIGLLATRKLLLKYFSHQTTSLVLLLLVFATNLAYYTIFESGMSHVYNFSLIAVALLMIDKWLKSPGTWTSVLTGLLLGLISLIRPSNTMLILFFLFWGCLYWPDLKERFRFLLRQYPQVIIMAACSLLVWLPQIIYWKIQTGAFFYNSYDEHFYFNQFHIPEALFGFRKGWFIYTPVMLVALAGLLFMKGEAKKTRLSIIVFTPLFIYIVYSWWCWWYGGSFGSRAMIDIYAIMGIPLGALIESGMTRKVWLKIVSVSLGLLFLGHGVFQTLQYYYGAIHWDSMTREAYLVSFGHLHPKQAFYCLLEQPDYDSAIKGLEEKHPEKTTSVTTDENDYLVSLNQIECPENQEYYTLVNVLMPDTAVEIHGSVVIGAGSNNSFPADLVVSAALYKDNNYVQSVSVEAAPITAGGERNTRWDFTLVPEDMSGRNYNIKVFLWAQKKSAFSTEKITVVLYDVKQWCSEIKP